MSDSQEQSVPSASAKPRAPSPRRRPLESNGAARFVEVLRKVNDGADPRLYFMCTFESCFYHCNRPNNLARHWTVEHEPCPVKNGQNEECGYRYQNYNDIKAHYKTMHPSIQKKKIKHREMSKCCFDCFYQLLHLDPGNEKSMLPDRNDKLVALDAFNGTIPEWQGRTESPNNPCCTVRLSKNSPGVKPSACIKVKRSENVSAQPMASTSTHCSSSVQVMDLNVGKTSADILRLEATFKSTMSSFSSKIDGIREDIRALSNVPGISRLETVLTDVEESLNSQQQVKQPCLTLVLHESSNVSDKIASPLINAQEFHANLPPLKTESVEDNDDFSRTDINDVDIDFKSTYENIANASQDSGNQSGNNDSMEIENNEVDVRTTTTDKVSESANQIPSVIPALPSQHEHQIEDDTLGSISSPSSQSPASRETSMASETADNSALISSQSNHPTDNADDERDDRQGLGSEVKKVASISKAEESNGDDTVHTIATCDNDAKNQESSDLDNADRKLHDSGSTGTGENETTDLVMGITDTTQLATELDDDAIDKSQVEPYFDNDNADEDHSIVMCSSGENETEPVTQSSCDDAAQTVCAESQKDTSGQETSRGETIKKLDAYIEELIKEAMIHENNVKELTEEKNELKETVNITEAMNVKLQFENKQLQESIAELKKMLSQSKEENVKVTLKQQETEQELKTLKAHNFEQSLRKDALDSRDKQHKSTANQPAQPALSRFPSDRMKELEKRNKFLEQNLAEIQKALYNVFQKSPLAQRIEDSIEFISSNPAINEEQQKINLRVFSSKFPDITILLYDMMIAELPSLKIFVSVKRVLEDAKDCLGITKKKLEIELKSLNMFKTNCPKIEVGPLGAEIMQTLTNTQGKNIKKITNIEEYYGCACFIDGSNALKSHDGNLYFKQQPDEKGDDFDKDIMVKAGQKGLRFKLIYELAIVIVKANALATFNIITRWDEHWEDKAGTIERARDSVYYQKLKKLISKNPHVNMTPVRGYDDLVFVLAAMSGPLNPILITNDNLRDLLGTDKNPSHVNTVRSAFKKPLSLLMDTHCQWPQRLMFDYISGSDRIILRCDGMSSTNLYNLSTRVFGIPASLIEEGKINLAARKTSNGQGKRVNDRMEDNVTSDKKKICK